MDPVYRTISSTEPQRATTVARWTGVLALSALLHWLLISLAGNSLHFPAWPGHPQAAGPAVQVRLVAPAPQPAPVQQVKPAAAPSPAPAAAVRPKPERRFARRQPPAAPAPTQPLVPRLQASPPAVPQMQANATAAPVAEVPLQQDPDAAATGEQSANLAAPAEPEAAQPASASAVAAEAPVQAPMPAPLHRIVPPPSAVLKYSVQALRDGQVVHGNGKITFQQDGTQYSVDGEAGILFFTVLNFRSSGEIDHWGISPVLYSEKRFRKSATNTHFQREANLITFSASTLSYPRAGGEQDRASLIWQLAAIGRGDASLFAPDANFDFFVAGVRDGEPWRLRVIGQEPVDGGAGATQAWHLVRLPRPGSYEQQLDIWLAPQQQWFPVKLRFTETNGDYLDMALSSTTLTAAPEPVASMPVGGEIK
ncbi:MAG: DUF3108 domain-containing protein [Janthinobacterium lividum]